MLLKDNRSRILRIFFDDPLPAGIGFQLREISRKVQVAPPSVKKYLKELEMEGLIFKKKHRIQGYPVYYANRDNDIFKFTKKIDLLARIKASGLLDHLWDQCLPEVIILFGSASRGEDLKESDIDIFIQSSEVKLHLEKYEKDLQRKINVFFSKEFYQLSKELKNNLLNGVILKGYLKVF
ncbi:nucleotidyltransferase domain-containing protein [Candidatus Woesearchaeota archaeon]|nr:nucleotidyltransferase domain-containing protein [Candidatus Woesearchaeota archaeon]